MSIQRLLNTYSQHAGSESAQRAFIEESRQKHLEALQDHHDMIRQLGSLWNQLAPISRLHPEILIKIFAMHAAEYRTMWWHLTSWIAYSHVCRHWRTIALTCPMLWDTVDFRALPACIAELLARTKQVPLYVTMDVVHGPRYDSGALSAEKLLILRQLLTEDIPRIVELKMRWCPPIENLSGPAGSLRKLYVHAPTVILDDKPIPFYTMLVGGKMPVLQDLNISVWSFTLRDILTALNGLPLLENLDLKYLPVDVPPSRPNDSMVTLPHLRHIMLYSGVKSCVNFLSYLVAPSVQHIGLIGDFLSHARDPLDFWDFAKITLLSGLRRITLIREGFHHTFRLTSGSAKTALSSVKSLKIYKSDSSDFQAICNALPLSDVETLTFKLLIPEFNPQSLFSMMPCLRIIRAHKLESLCYFLRILFSRSNSRLGVPHYVADSPCRLEVLEFSKIDFTEGYSKAYHIHELEGLRKYLGVGRSNSNSQLEIRRVVYKGCCSLDTYTASLIRDITGAVSDSFSVDEEVNDDSSVCEDVLQPWSQHAELW